MDNRNRPPSRIYENPVINEPVWYCVLCNRTFANNFSLRRHMRLIHNAPRTEVEIGDDNIMYGRPHYDNVNPI